ncbi:MAG: SDR family NAD(P)-dependent oxidoreductase [Chloroflexi bacterium]|nr:MAG: SDR family NAD(P)-dependent oxidoreductase [Chloroflexota bacterium]MBL1194028.1 SDR family NAD(P)-dependent oxidoreductase [Chloroflexota bacterium]NOH11322.1 SDR family NAD(P)-dependent oxidoreductase [Chloroflexota bacterium]
MNDFKQTYGPWAVVTGASSGIGEEFARQLASKGLNLVLVARRKEKLDALGEELCMQHGIDYRSAKVDLADTGILDAIETATHDLDIGLLVSNAGYAKMGEFLTLPAEELEKMLRLNVVTHMELSHYFGNRMVSKGRKGGLLLVSSMAAFQGVPYLANYSGAKSYILNLGESLNNELKDKGIDVSVLVPGPTDTEMMTSVDADMSSMPMPAMPASQAVKEALQALERNKPYLVPGTLNRLMVGLMGRRLLTRGANVKMWGTIMKRTLLPVSR